MKNSIFKRIVAFIAALALYTATANAAATAVTSTRPQNTFQSSTLNPTGTTSVGTNKMMGLAGGFTPSNSGQVIILVSGDITSNTAGDGAVAQISFSVNSSGCPANGATATGTMVGSPVHYTASPTTVDKVPFMLAGFASLTQGTAYCVDVQLQAVTGGTATISDVVIIVHEL